MKKKKPKRIIHTLAWLVKLSWKSEPRYVTLWIVTMILEAAPPVAKLWVAKRIMDAVVAGVGSNSLVSTIKAVAFFVLIDFLLTLIQHALSEANGVLSKAVEERATISIQEQILRKSISLDVRHFESPQFYDLLNNARQVGASSIIYTLQGMLRILRASTTIGGVVMLLMALNWWTALVLLAVIIPKFVIDCRFAWVEHQLEKRQTPDRRRATNLFDILTQKEYAKEVKLFGFDSILVKLWRRITERIQRERLRLRRRSEVTSSLANWLSVLAYYGCYLYVVYNTLSKRLTLGDMYMYIQAFARLQEQGRDITGGLTYIYEEYLNVKRLSSFLHLEPDIQLRAASSVSRFRYASYSTQGFPDPISQKIEFQGVSFKYQPDLPFVLKNVNLTIYPGECIAIVGNNGAGKTTLVKLLARIYEPTDGAITIDGIDLRDIEPAHIRENIGVIFQDYAHYNFTARENIGLGDIAQMENIEAIKMAAKKGGAHAFLERLPQGYETTLGTSFENGIELSGGEWQKVALSRAFIRNAQILILDEPTASLDVMTEYEIFRNFRRLTEGKTVFIISHRFSTVRMANRIAVLQDGQITECGTHEELMQLGGYYAQMFTTQLKSYGLPVES